jgi:hypothetical protein
VAATLSVLAMLAALGVFARPLAAQQPVQSSRWQPELRADAFTGDPWAAHAGVGLGLRLGYYARLALVAGGGASGGWGDVDAEGDATRASGRVELLGRFVLDPFRERDRGFYAAAGLVQRLEQGARPRTKLTAVLGVEGRSRGGWAPSLEAGFGGGVRVGLVLRRALADGR